MRYDGFTGTIAVLWIFGAGCGGKGSGAPVSSGPPPEAGCALDIQQHPSEGQMHVPDCSAVTYGTNPPSSGNHYPDWAAFQSYDFAVPRGFLVHDLEHGAVVISYRCDQGCAADLASIQELVSSLEPDSTCAGNSARLRVVVTPDPQLDVPFAAAAWTWTLRAACFDPDSFAWFIGQHLGKAPEDTCEDGIDVTSQTCPGLR